MKIVLACLVVAVGMLASGSSAHAVVCADGVYRAGCAGPNGAVGVHKQPYGYHPYGYHSYGYHSSYYHRPGVSCASGPYRAGCAGPHGAAVVRRPY